MQEATWAVSCMVSTFLSVQQEINKRTGEFHFVSLPPHIVDLIGWVGVEGFFKIISLVIFETYAFDPSCSMTGSESRKGMHFNSSNAWYKGWVAKSPTHLATIMATMIGNKNWMSFVISICDKERKELRTAKIKRLVFFTEFRKLWRKATYFITVM